uniref:E3 ubiquitin/ISG15 ligase TRIM25-like n=1 Tax=Astyanax mexicanus TaxID=7994 RepID=W5L7L7_ASTMX
MKSDQSMDRPIAFEGYNDVTLLSHKRLQSPAPSYISMKSDKSMDRPIAFINGSPSPSIRLKEERPSPAPTYCSVNSDKSMDRPIAFSGAGHISKFPADLLTEDHFRCLVCSDVLKEPVSIPCGHSYCKTCIQTYWNKPAHDGSYSCPQCRKRFRTRPALNPNSALATVVQKLQLAGFSPALPAHCYAGPGDVSCDFCTGRKLRAVKSCLTCPASYCETHVKQHYTVAALQRHTLVEATGDLERRLCKLHQRDLEVFCKTDQTFICFICTMEDHKGHETALSKSEDSAVEVGYSC